jgi:BarA-like signal transduction histidine kinase
VFYSIQSSRAKESAPACRYSLMLENVADTFESNTVLIENSVAQKVMFRNSLLHHKHSLVLGMM